MWVEMRLLQNNFIHKQNEKLMQRSVSALSSVDVYGIMCECWNKTKEQLRRRVCMGGVKR